MAHEYTPNFEKAYKHHGKLVEKWDAFSEWKKLKAENNFELRKEIWEGIKRYKCSEKWEAGFVDSFRKFLHTRMWHDRPKQKAKFAGGFNYKCPRCRKPQSTSEMCPKCEDQGQAQRARAAWARTRHGSDSATAIGDVVRKVTK